MSEDVYSRKFEERHLDEVIDHIDAEIERSAVAPSPTAAHERTTEAVQSLYFNHVYSLQQSRPNPYFGRIDFRADCDAASGRFYLGRSFIGPDKVLNWTAPIGRLFYRPTDGCYQAPTGYIIGQVMLKRQINISNATLQSFDDVLKIDLPNKSQVDKVLERSLSSSGEVNLTDIVETIQPEQYEQIAAVDKPVMIVQGAAGSGKSIVGQHRLAFLLSPHSQISGERPRTSRVIALGPSMTFLRYVAELLPSLGYDDIQQTTMRKWLHSMFSRTVRLDRENLLFRRLTQNRTRHPSNDEFEAERFKGTMKMTKILDRRLRELRKAFPAEPQEIYIDMPDETVVVVGAAELRKLIRRKSRNPLNTERNRFIDRIVGILWQRYSRRDSIQSAERAFAGFQNRVRGSVEEQVRFFWPYIDFRDEYGSLIMQPKQLVAYSGNDLTADQANLIRRSGMSSKGFQDTDLAPLLYLDHLLNEHPSQAFDHIVLDEAQDISPLEIEMLKMHSRNGWFTILGDVRQKLLPYRGVNNWRQVSDLFDRSDVARYQIRTTYRTTVEITRFCNRILRNTSGSTSPPQPYNRHGDKPTFVQSRTRGEMFDSIVRTIRDFKSKKNSSIGILTRYGSEAKAIQRHLHSIGVRSHLLSAESELQDGITVSPILLTKGLEFDAVIVAAVHDKNFSLSDFDSRILYLACTRARHNLSIQWFGNPSPAIPGIS